MISYLKALSVKLAQHETIIANSRLKFSKIKLFFLSWSVLIKLKCQQTKIDNTQIGNLGVQDYVCLFVHWFKLDSSNAIPSFKSTLKICNFYKIIYIDDNLLRKNKWLTRYSISSIIDLGFLFFIGVKQRCIFYNKIV